MKTQNDDYLKTKKLKRLSFFALFLLFSYYFFLFQTMPIARDDKIGLAAGGAYLFNIIFTSISLFGTIYYLTFFIKKFNEKIKTLLLLGLILVLGLVFALENIEFTLYCFAIFILVFSHCFILWKLKTNYTALFIFNLLVLIIFYSISFTDLRFQGIYDPNEWSYSQLFEIIATLNVLGLILNLVLNRLKPRKSVKSIYH